MVPVPPVPDKLLTIKQVAKELHVSEGWVRKHKELPRIKLGRVVRIRRSDLQALLEERLKRD